MNVWNRLLIGNDNHIEKRNVLWNMAGSVVYAIPSILLGSAVTRILGADMGGIFLFAFSTFGQQMFIVAYFGMRPVQITDTAGRDSFGDYRSFRLMTCAAAVLFALAYVFISPYSELKRNVILLMVLYKILDGFADCYDSEFQRDGRLYLTGKSNAGRTFLSMAIFLYVLLTTKDLVLSCLSAVAGQMAGIVLFCLMPAHATGHIDFSVHRGYAGRLFKKSIWLFLSAFLDFYIFAASRYAVNRYLTDADNGYYNIIFIPTSVINLLSQFVIRPVITSLSEDWEKGNCASFRKTVFRISGMIAVFTAAGMLAAYLFGIPVLAFLLGKTAGAGLKPYTGALVLVILGGGFYALLNLLYYVLVILKSGKSIFLIYGVSCVIAWFASGIMVRKYGINGAAGIYLILMILLAASFAAVSFCLFGKKKPAAERQGKT